VTEAMSDLKRRSRNMEIGEVGSISVNGQKMIGDEIAEAMQKVGHRAASRSRRRRRRARRPQQRRARGHRRSWTSV
jgi:hypothetical protein